MKKIIKTDMLNRYMLKLIFRVSIFIAVLIMYIADKDMMLEFLQYEFTFSITLLHLVWIVFMVTMILHLFPHDKLSMALRKGESQNYVPVRNY